MRQLAAQNVRTIAHVRPDSMRLAEWRERFAAMGAEVDTTPWAEGAMRDAMEQHRVTHVFALLGTTRARGKLAAERGTSESYESVDYALTSMLLRAAVASGQRPRFLYLSSSGVRRGSRNPYLAVRWRIEEELRASGLSPIIARPSIITGPDRDEDRPAERIAGQVVDGLLHVAGLLGARRLRNRYRSTTNRTLADALVRLAFDARASGVVESEGLRGAEGAA